MTSPIRAAVLDVIKIPSGAQTHYTYTLSTSVQQAEMPMMTRVEVKLRTRFVDILCGRIQQASESGTLHSQQLRSAGQMLYKLLFPNTLRAAHLLSKRLEDWRDPLVISTNDAEIPWELMHDGREFLGVRLPLGRRMITQTTFHPGQPIDRIRRALIVSNPTEDLPSSDAEAAKLAEFLKARGIECVLLSGVAADVMAVSGHLTGGGFDVFHYSGHIGMDEDGQPALKLFDEQLATGDILALLDRQVDEPPNAPPIVFLNGCRSAEQLSSVCGAFLNTGSRIVVGARYRIVDEAARDFAEHWYGSLLTGMTAGGALRASRASLREGPDGTWAAFVLFGQPAAQLWQESGGQPQEEPPPVPPEPVAVAPPVEVPPGGFWAEHAHQLTPEVARLAQRMTDLAAEFGIVTSFHCAAALLDEVTALSAAIEAAGVELEAVADVLQIFTSLADPDAPPAGGNAEVVLSDTVQKIFMRAIETASADRRQQASLEDLTSAFIATGGGHAGELLSQFGVELTTGSSLFSRAGDLHERFVAPETLRAIQCARFLSSIRGESIIGSYSLMLGCALAGSPVFREALLDQGPSGEAVVHANFPEGLRLTSRDFSHRAREALESAFAEGGGMVTDGHMLVHALDDPTGKASSLVRAWGMDVDRLRASCQSIAAAAKPPDGDGTR